MAWTEADRDALKAAIARGVKKLRMSNGEEVEYQSLAEMRSALSLIEAELLGSGAGAVTLSYVRAGRGL